MATPPATPVSLLADNRGKIAHLLLSFADYDIIPTLYGLLRQLPSRVKLTIATPKGERAQLLRSLLKEWPRQQAASVELLELDEPTTFWVRDEFVAANRSRVVLPQRYGLQGLPPALRSLVKQGRIQVVPSLINFDGGNVVVSAEQVFVGYNLVRENLGKVFANQKDLLDYLQQLFGKPVVLVGSPSKDVPHEHIDMILTPLGGRKLLWGDPRLAVSILEKHPELLAATYGKVYFNEATTPLPKAAKKLLFSSQEFIPRLQNELGEHRSASTVQDSDVTLALLYARNKLPANLELFDAVASDLSAQGFELVRLPVLMNHNLPNNLFITYNNMLLEGPSKGAPGKPTSYLPSYNLPPLDQAAQKTLRDLGFSVKPIDVQNISFYNGTLRCITQVLERTY